MNTYQLYEKLFEGHTITIRVEDFKQFESLRVSLIRYHSETKKAGLSEDSLRSSYDSEGRTGTFKLERLAPKQWEVVSVD